MSVTLIVSCQHIMVGTLARLPRLTGRKVGMMLSLYGPYTQGYTRATMVGIEGSDFVKRSEFQKPILVRIGVCNLTP